MKLISFLFKSSSLVTRTVAQLAVVGIVGTLSLGAMSSSAFTSLNAVATNASPVITTSGTLKLIQADNGSGFTTAISNMAPADTVNRYVNYTNSGLLPATGLTVSVADGTPTLLTTDGTKGLQVTISSCSVAWTAATGVCSVTTTPLLASTSLLSLKTTPGVLIASPTVIAPSAVEYLKFSIVLPNTTETTTNGVLPGGTVQGLSASLTWTLTEVQAAAATTNS